MLGKIIKRDATLTVNDLDDGFLSSVGDVALVDTRDLTSISVYVNRLVDDQTPEAGEASLDLGTLAAHNLNTVVSAKAPGAGGNAIDVDIVFDTNDPPIIVESGGVHVVIHCKSTVSTVAQVEAAITASSTLIEVKTPGTGATVLSSVTDNFAATPLAGGTDDVTGSIALLVETTLDGTNFASVVTLDETDWLAGNNVAFEWPLRDANGMATSAKQVRVTIVTLSEASSFSVTVAGEQRVFG